MRTRFARWASVSGGLFLIDIATSNHIPSWSLMVAGFWAAFWLIPEYGKLWQAGYSWRDVLMRPPAPDALETRTGKPGKLPRQLPPPLIGDFGAYRAQIAQAQSDRAAILKLMERLSPDEAEMLPEIAQTVDGLVQRATDLARTMHAMDTNLDTDGLPRIEDRIAALQREPDGTERSRRLALLERQRQAIGDLQSRRDQVSRHLESCLLAIQSLRFDLLRLRSAGINAVVGDLTQATQQARALSRDVDMAIAAAGEVREALK
jgi:serine/threonine-protein kinase